MKAHHNGTSCLRRKCSTSDLGKYADSPQVLFYVTESRFSSADTFGCERTRTGNGQWCHRANVIFRHVHDRTSALLVSEHLSLVTKSSGCGYGLSTWLISGILLRKRHTLQSIALVTIDIETTDAGLRRCNLNHLVWSNTLHGLSLKYRACIPLMKTTTSELESTLRSLPVMFREAQREWACDAKRREWMKRVQPVTKYQNPDYWKAESRVICLPYRQRITFPQKLCGLEKFKS